MFHLTRMTTAGTNLWLLRRNHVFQKTVLRCFSATTNNTATSSKYSSLYRFKSSLASVVLEDDPHWSDEESASAVETEVHRLSHIRNVGVLAHVDAGKTTVTERMLALAGVVRKAGNVDDGNTVTDYLPAERERGITIQSAAISFAWPWHNNERNDHSLLEEDDIEPKDHVTVSLIDTPGHVDFSVEVNRSVAVLDGAVLVVDAVAGVQAQTETVWRALTKARVNNHVDIHVEEENNSHALPCLALVNKMDKDGCHFSNAIQSLREKLPGANPIPIQLPLFQKGNAKSSDDVSLSNLVAIPVIEDDDKKATEHHVGEFVGTVDLIHLRAVVWPSPTNSTLLPEQCAPTVIPLLHEQDGELKSVIDNCPITEAAIQGRWKLVEALAEAGDEWMEEYYLQETQPTHAELRAALRRITLQQKGLPVLASAALRGKGIEPVLDAIADFLPSPLDRPTPELMHLQQQQDPEKQKKKETTKTTVKSSQKEKNAITLGHSLHPSLLALAFKVVHMKGRGGSGDGRVVFARVYSGTLRERDTVQVISPPALGEEGNTEAAWIRKERVGGMLELAGGKFGNLQNGICQSGGVCALVGLKSVVTGDTIVMYPNSNNSKKNSNNNNKKHQVHDPVCLTGVASPKPVLTVRLEAESTEQQTRLSEALQLLAIEDPSLVVEETESSTLLSGLGELHIEVTLDRLQREFGLHVLVGAPSVTYRETLTESLETTGLHNYDRMIGGTRLQAEVHLILEPTAWTEETYSASSSILLTEPTVSVSSDVKEFMGFDPDASDDTLMVKSELFRGLVQGCLGALKRGPVGSYPMANIQCKIVAVDAEAGLPQLQSLPGALRAAAADAVTSTLSKNRATCSVLEPKMSVEIVASNDMVGPVLSDLTGRRGTIGDVLMGEEKALGRSGKTTQQAKALVRGEVPLIEILGYANSLRSLTGGEGTFTAEYKGHSPCEL